MGFYVQAFYLHFLLERLLIRTKEKGSVNFVLQYPASATLDELVSFTLLKTDNNLLLSEVVVAKNNLSINKRDTVIIEQFVDDFCSIDDLG